MKLLKLVTDKHKEISEQESVVSGFLEAFNKKEVLSDLSATVNFFSVDMVRHFIKENVIFNALLKTPGISPKVSEVVAATLKEHDKFMEEFKRLADAAANIDSGRDELSLDFIKKCQYIAWALGKHAQVEDFVIFPEIEEKMGEDIFKLLEAELSKI